MNDDRRHIRDLRRRSRRQERLTPAEIALVNLDDRLRAAHQLVQAVCMAGQDLNLRGKGWRMGWSLAYGDEVFDVRRLGFAMMLQAIRNHPDVLVTTVEHMIQYLTRPVRDRYAVLSVFDALLEAEREGEGG